MRFNRHAQIEQMIIGSHQRCYIMMCIPTLGMVPIEFLFTAARMQMPINGQVFQHIIKGMEIGKARDKAVHDLLAMGKEKPKYLFFLGDDMIPEWNSFVRLYEAMEEEEWDVLTGLYYMKGEPPTPLVWRDDHIGRMKPNVHFKVGERVRIDLTGLDFTLIRVSLLEKMTPPYFKTGPSLRAEIPTPLEPYIEPKSIIMHTEDVWFFQKAKQLGAKCGVHSGVRVGHMDIKSGAIY